MDKIIKLNCKNGANNYLQKLNSVTEGIDSKTYIVKASEGIIPEYDEFNHIYVNIVDGPNIRLGSDIEGFIVRFIDFIPGTGCIITFK
jgi:hypothetical protein